MVADRSVHVWKLFTIALEVLAYHRILQNLSGVKKTSYDVIDLISKNLMLLFDWTVDNHKEVDLLSRFFGPIQSIRKVSLYHYYVYP